MENSTKNRPILILGSQGNLGSQIVKILREQNQTIVAWTRYDCNLFNAFEIEQKITQLYPAVVINTVAYNAVDACENQLSEQELAISLNCQLPAYLAQICHKIKAKLVHFSSNYVFSGNKTFYSETEQTNPINFYGLTKAQGEKAILSYKNTAFDFCILRVANLFGPLGTGQSSKPSFFDSIKDGAQKRDMIDVVADEKCCFTYTKDIATVLSQVLYEKKFYGIYHLINSGPALSWFDAATLYFDVIKEKTILQPICSTAFNRPAARPKTAVLVSTRSSLPTMRSFEHALIDYIQEISAD